MKIKLKNTKKPNVSRTDKAVGSGPLVSLKKLKPGDKFSYKNVGYGLVSYEEGSDAIGVKGSRLFTDTFDKGGMEWNGTTWVFDGGLGLRTEIATIEELKRYESENG